MRRNLNMADNVCGIVDVVDFEVQDFVTRDLLFSVDYATSVSFSTSAESLDIRGGIGMPVRITTHHTREANFTSELPLIDINVLGVMLGKKVATSSITAPKSERLLVDATSGKASISETPLTNTLKVYLLADNGRSELKVGDPTTEEDKYLINGKEITLHTAHEGKYIKAIYDYTADTGTQMVRLTAKDFPGYCRITGTGYRLDESGGKHPVSFIAHRFKPDPNFEITFAGGTATNITFSGKLSPNLVDNEEVYFDLIYLSADDGGES